MTGRINRNNGCSVSGYSIPERNGPKRSRQFKRLGVDSIFDLSSGMCPGPTSTGGHPTPISLLSSGEAAAVRATVKGTHAPAVGVDCIFLSLLEDDTGLITARVV
jgi:hypothetical protein